MKRPVRRLRAEHQAKGVWPTVFGLPTSTPSFLNLPHLFLAVTANLFAPPSDSRLSAGSRAAQPSSSQARCNHQRGQSPSSAFSRQLRRSTPQPRRRVRPYDGRSRSGPSRDLRRPGQSPSRLGLAWRADLHAAGHDRRFRTHAPPPPRAGCQSTPAPRQPDPTEGWAIQDGWATPNSTPAGPHPAASSSTRAATAGHSSGFLDRIAVLKRWTTGLCR